MSNKFRETARSTPSGDQAIGAKQQTCSSCAYVAQLKVSSTGRPVEYCAFGNSYGTLCSKHTPGQPSASRSVICALD
jgi:hypothetical protein